MLSIDVATSFFIASVILALAPGPDNIFVLTQSAIEGRLAGIIVTLGLATGLIFHTAAVALGIAVIFQTSIIAFTVLKFCGVVYLLYLAWGAFRASASKISTKDRKPLGKIALYRRGIIMNITNPKVSIFFLAFLPQFVATDGGPIEQQIIFLGVIFMIATLLMFSAIAIVSGSLGKWLKQSDNAQIWLNRIAGTVFVGLAAKLAFTEK